MVGFYSKFFGQNFGQKDIFDGIFGRSAEISAADPQMKFRKLKIFGNFFQIFSFFFFKLVQNIDMNLKKVKKILSRSNSLLEASKKFSLKLINFSCQNFSSKTLRKFFL